MTPPLFLLVWRPMSSCNCREQAITLIDPPSPPPLAALWPSMSEMAMLRQLTLGLYFVHEQRAHLF